MMAFRMEIARSDVSQKNAYISGQRKYFAYSTEEL
jgi:hypothetical protein